jgi:hypothetical protein
VTLPVRLIIWVELRFCVPIDPLQFAAHAIPVPPITEATRARNMIKCLCSFIIFIFVLALKAPGLSFRLGHHEALRLQPEEEKKYYLVDIQKDKILSQALENPPQK